MEDDDHQNMRLEQTTVNSILEGMTYFAYIGKKTQDQCLLNVLLESGTFMKFDLCAEELFEV